MIAGRTPMLATGGAGWSLVASLAAALALAIPGAASSQGAPDAVGPVIVVELDTTIDKVSARFLERALDQARDEHASVVIVRIDTPGGLLNATRERLLGEPAQVTVRLAPQGEVRLAGETWTAELRGADSAEVGEQVRVAELSQVGLLVEPAASEGPAPEAEPVHSPVDPGR